MGPISVAVIPARNDIISFWQSAAEQMHVAISQLSRYKCSDYGHALDLGKVHFDDRSSSVSFFS